MLLQEQQEVTTVLTIGVHWRFYVVCWLLHREPDEACFGLFAYCIQL